MSASNTINLSFPPNKGGFADATRQLEAAGHGRVSGDLSALDLALEKFSPSAGHFQLSVEPRSNGEHQLSGTATLYFSTTKKVSLSPHIAWNTPITDIEMSARTREILASLGATTLGEVAVLSTSCILPRVSNTAEIGVLRRTLQEHGLRFNMTNRPEA